MTTPISDLSKETKMDIEQIRVARREMEEAIRAAVHDAMKAFREKTSMSPRSIDIQIVEVTMLGDRENRFVVGDVRADIPL